ncbi:MAG: hypothetical protein V2B18_06740 [Pseudomonadota bacterium]
MFNAQLIVITLMTTITIVCSSLTRLEAFEIFPRPVGQYTIQRNDETLSKISGEFYQNPSLWPFLWNQNPAVKFDKDAKGPDEKKEIAVGSKINLYHQSGSSTVSNQELYESSAIPDDLRFLVSKVPYQGIPYDKKYFRFKLSPRKTRVWGYIVSCPDPGKMYYLERDLVYVRFRPSKRQCIMVGDRFGIYRERGPLQHPLDPERRAGYMSEIVGEVEVTSTGHELVTCIILESYVELQRGEKITLFTPRDKEVIPSKTHRLLTGTILNSATRDAFYLNTSNLENDIVFIDRGECDGVRDGMLVNVYKPSQPQIDPFHQRQINTPDRFAGEGMVLKAFQNNSTVVITRSREEILPGDIIKTVSD